MGAQKPRDRRAGDARAYPWIGLTVGVLGAVGAWAIVPAGQTPVARQALELIRLDPDRMAPAFAAPGPAVERLNARPARTAALQAFLDDHRTRLVKQGPRRFTGTAGANMVDSLRAAGVPQAAIADYLGALGRRLKLVDGISVADRFDLVMPHARYADGTVRFGELQYAGLDRVGASDVQLVRWKVDGRGDWVDAQGLGSRIEGSFMPVTGAVSSGFGTRWHPILGQRRFHRGLDLRAAYGTPVRATDDGVVTMAGWAGGYGRQVRIAHGGHATSYSHMSRFAVVPGTRVQRGQVIGYVGSSGLSTGPHLHFELHRGGRAVDPRMVKGTVQPRVESGEERAVRASLRQYLGAEAS